MLEELIENIIDIGLINKGRDSVEEQRVLFERLKDIKDYWVKTSVESLDKQSDLTWSEHEKEYNLLQSLISEEKSKKAYSKIIDELLKGVIHSILVMFDGGDELTDKFNIDIINADTKKSLKEDIALHEEFIGYLVEVENQE